jgi:tetratricopeptide (TPR) repeat protein
MNWKLIICSLLVAFPALADEFKSANALYDAGKFAEAAAAYEKIEPKTANVYYNLGNALFRQGKLGWAILNYERARRLSPRDPDILANLKFAQRKLGVDEVNAPPKAWQRFLRSAIESRTLGEWSVYELVGLWLTVLAVGGWVFFPKARTGLLVASVAAFLGFAVAGFALSYETISERTAPRGIVVADETEARFAPLPDSTVHFRVAEGTKVAILEDRGQWLFVERADGQQGWVKAEVVGRI